MYFRLWLPHLLPEEVDRFLYVDSDVLCNGTLLPLRDVFVALFFVTIGALIDPGSLVANVPLLATMVAMVVVGKLVLWTLVVWLFRQSLWTAPDS